MKGSPRQSPEFQLLLLPSCPKTTDMYSKQLFSTSFEGLRQVLKGEVTRQSKPKAGTTAQIL